MIIMPYNERKQKNWEQECIEQWTEIQTFLKSEEFASISDISHFLKMNRATLQGFIRAMVVVGYLKVKVGHSIIVSLTEKGKKLIILPKNEKEAS